MFDKDNASTWKGPTVKEIAALAGVGPATVDRVLNNRSGVREATRERVARAVEKLSREKSNPAAKPLNIRLFCDSGITFNNVMREAEQEVNRTIPNTTVTGHYLETHRVDPDVFAREILEQGLQSDGVLLTAREHPVFNRAVRKLMENNVPVVSLMSDLPNSRRHVYVGNDQYAAGSVAAHLLGKALGPKENRVLFVMSASFRCQQEREMGFRRVLRTEFPNLQTDERVLSDDVPETTSELLRAYFEKNGVPAAIYNIAGANRGVASALESYGAERDTFFVGHELTNYSRHLLETGTMDYVISHDFSSEISTAVRWIREFREGKAKAPRHTPILVHTRYNCGL